MSESSPIKDALYAKIDDIGQEQIHQLLLNGKFSELFEKIYGPVIQSVHNIEEYEDLHENKRGPEKNIRSANKEFILTQVKTSPESRGERHYTFVE